MKTIIVTGVPGTGKTALSKKLAKKLNFYYFDVNRFITKNRLYEGYDKKRKTKVVDINKLNKKLIEEIKKIKSSGKFNGMIIDSHLSHYLPKKHVDLCIVTKCGINELNKRLIKKKFSKSKVMENLQAEIFDVCLNEAMEMNHKVLIIDTAKVFNISYIARKI